MRQNAVEESEKRRRSRKALRKGRKLPFLADR